MRGKGVGEGNKGKEFRGSSVGDGVSSVTGFLVCATGCFSGSGSVSGGCNGNGAGYGGIVVVMVAVNGTATVALPIKFDSLYIFPNPLPHIRFSMSMHFAQFTLLF